MQHLLKQLFDRLGQPSEQKSEKTALAVVYCMFLAFTLVCTLGMVSAVYLSQLNYLPSSECEALALKQLPNRSPNESPN
jgi:hypothetical protein